MLCTYASVRNKRLFRNKPKQVKKVKGPTSKLARRDGAIETGFRAKTGLCKEMRYLQFENSPCNRAKPTAIALDSGRSSHSKSPLCHASLFEIGLLFVHYGKGLRGEPTLEMLRLD